MPLALPVSLASTQAHPAPVAEPAGMMMGAFGRHLTTALKGPATAADTSSLSPLSAASTADVPASPAPATQPTPISAAPAAAPLVTVATDTVTPHAAAKSAQPRKPPVKATSRPDAAATAPRPPAPQPLPASAAGMSPPLASLPPLPQTPAGCPPAQPTGNISAVAQGGYPPFRPAAAPVTHPPPTGAMAQSGATRLPSAQVPAATAAAQPPTPAPSADSLATLHAAMAAPAASPAVPSPHDTPAAAPATATHAASITPAAQLVPALVSLGGAAPAGTTRLTVRLDPAELGRVQVRIDRQKDAPATVQVIVERPETLTLMLRDQTHLQQALDRAGVATTGGGLSFHLGSQAPSTAEGEPQDRGAQTSAARAATGAFLSPAHTSATTPVRLRAGIDITA